MSDGKVRARAVVHRVLGVDACRTGWVGIVLTAYADGSLDVAGLLEPDIAALVAAAEATAGPIDVVGVDIPIGLPDRGRRQADERARRLLGRRASSLFTTPTRAALCEPDYARANAVNRDLAGEGISRQAHGLRTKILDVDGWRGCSARSDRPLLEIHPELSFVTMARPSDPPLERKLSFAGSQGRLARLAREGIRLDQAVVGPAGVAGTDDVVDAAAIAWSALRAARGEARCVPEPPQVFSDGWPAAIWA